MAEPVRKPTSEEQGDSKRSRFKEIAMQVASTALVTLASGFCLAAGGHCYGTLARRLGGQPGNNVHPIRKVI